MTAHSIISASDSDQPTDGDNTRQPEAQSTEEKQYKIQFRKDQQVFTASSTIPNLTKLEVVMLQTDHGLEPSHILGFGPQIKFPNIEIQSKKKDQLEGLKSGEDSKKITYGAFRVVRRASEEETGCYKRLIERERDAFDFCQEKIVKHQLRMKLIRVEIFFNGSKMIFYFTADKRVDFRGLVKDLVHEFRTRVEMRQVGVRHETKMIGGLGCCGRDLCCAAFIKTFAPVSIRMAKEQDLPLNPAKISGICNRLLCCLTYEYPLYREMKKNMPRQGRTILVHGKPYKVIQRNILNETLTVIDPENGNKTRVMPREEWQGATLHHAKSQAKSSQPAKGKRLKPSTKENKAKFFKKGKPKHKSRPSKFKKK